MEINIGDNSKRDERALTVYEAFSEADEKYVREMLSDAAAARIREANRKKSFRIKSSVAAIAAVFALVIGLNVIPAGRMNKDSGGSAYKTAEAPQGDNAKSATIEGKTNEAEKRDEGAMNDEAPQAVQQEAAAAADEDNTPPPEYAEETETLDGMDKQESADGKTVAGDATLNGNVDSMRPSVTEEAAGDSGAGFGAGEYVKLGNGAEYYVGEELGTDKYCGADISDGATADGDTKACEFKGFDPEYLVVLKHGGRLYAAITADLERSDLSELSEGLHFSEYLRCDGVPGGEKNDEADFESFKSSILEGKDAGKYVFTDELPKDTGLTFVCRLGTEDRTFVQPIVITIGDKSVSVTCMNGFGYYVRS